jgi:esterase/lipase superfamily enzyme
VIAAYRHAPPRDRRAVWPRIIIAVMLAARRPGTCSGIVLALLLSATTGCGVAPLPHGNPTSFTIVPIFYGTDREPVAEPRPAAYYGPARAEAVSFGTCLVSIPSSHRVGEPGTPPGALPEDPSRHITVLSVRPADRDQLVAQIRSRVAQSARREVMVFVHGFNTGFASACRVAARIAADVRFAGTSILWSWPSADTVWAYARDEDQLALSTTSLERFLDTMMRETEADAVHVIAHGMGSRAVLNALASLDTRPGLRSARLVRELVLVGPDVDLGTLRTQLKAISRHTGRITLYLAGDQARVLAALLDEHPNRPDGQTSVAESAVDIIDSSQLIDGWLPERFVGTAGTAYLQERALLNDLADLIGNRMAASKRSNLRERGSSPSWELRP